MRIEELATHGAPTELIRRWSGRVQELTDVQDRAVRAGVLGGDSNLLVAAPTSSGKTFVGEMAATTAVLRGRRSRAVFLVPFKALAEEHFADFRTRYGDLFALALATGDHPDADDDVRRGRFNLAVMTYEKLRGFLVQDSSFLERLACVVVDEVQMLGDRGRGPGLELLLTHILREPRPPQLVALSASLEDTEELAAWLRATPIVSNHRPVPLREGVCAISGEAVFADAGGAVVETLVRSQPDRESLLARIVVDSVSAGEQLLVFYSTVRETVFEARRLAGLLPARGLASEVAEALARLEQTESTQTLAFTMAAGVAYHNAELSFEERSLVERAFRDGAVRVLVSTTTLAMGVNLPCDRVIVATAQRPERSGNNWLFRSISATEYKNAAGRAGRLGTRERGTAILLADDPLERDALLREYALAPHEPVTSQLAGRPFGDLIFEVLATGSVHSAAELLDFVRATFVYRTFYAREGGGDDSVRSAVDEAVNRCVESGLVDDADGALRARQVASGLAANGVGLQTAARLAELARADATEHLTRDDVLFEVCKCREMPAYPFPPDRDPRPFVVDTSWNATPGSSLHRVLRAQELSEPEPHAVVRAAFLRLWTAGVDARVLARVYRGVNGRRAVDAARTAAWLVETLAKASATCGASREFIGALRVLGLELRYGVPAALAAVARLEVSGIGRGDLVRLLEAGRPELLDPEALVEMEVEEFGHILTASQIQRLREKLALTVRDSLRRRKAEHLIRADAANLPGRVIRELYEARGAGLEQAVRDALALIGLPAKRIVRQPHGEPDVIVEYGGSVLISVTASEDDAAPVKWNKVREVLGAGAGMNPVNCVCIARPGFQTRAEEAARDMAREEGPRRLLLVSIPILCEMVIQHARGTLDTDTVGKLLSGGRGVLDEAHLLINDAVTENERNASAP